MTIEELIQLTEFVRQLDGEITTAEAKLKELQDKRKDIVSKTLVDAFRECGLDELKLADGTKYSLKSAYVGSISEANREAAMSWLREHRHEGIIKDVVTIPFGAGGDSEFKRQVIERLRLMEVTFDRKETVHPQTLNAFVNEQVANDPSFPKELFSATLIEKVEPGKKRGN